MKLQNLGQRVYDVADATVNTGGAVLSGLPLGFATYNFSNEFYSSGISWGLLSVIGGISIYNRIRKRENLNKLYAGAKALIYVSDREAFGLPPMEALSFGVPSVIADNELGHELFGEYAFYAKSGSINDIADAMREAISNEKNQSFNL